MNRKKLAKLLFQTTQIKELFESQQFDATTINNVIAQEIMREQNDEVIADLERKLALANSDIKEYIGRVADVKGELKQARTLRDREGAIEAGEELQQLAKDLDRLSGTVQKLEGNLKIAKERALQTSTTKDDEVVAQIAQKISDTVKASEPSATEPQPNTAAIDALNDLNKAVVNVAQKSTTAAAEEPELEPTPEPEPEPELPAAPGWANAKAAARKITAREGVTAEQISASLENIEAFQNFWNVQKAAETKLQQARELFDQGYFQERLQQVAAIPDAEQQAEEAENLAATAMGYNEFLNTLGQKQPDYKLPANIKFPTEIPKTEEEFKQEFIEPIAPEPATTGQSRDELITLANQVISLVPDLIPTDLQADDDIKEFIGWYVSNMSRGTLNEGIEDLDTDYRQRLNKFDEEKRKKIATAINANTEQWKRIFTGLDDLIKDGKIDLAGEPEANVSSEAEEVLENTPEVDPEADEDLSPLAEEEMNTSWIETLDTFYGKDPNKSSFMRQFLLRKQSEMLYAMINVLGEIVLGNKDGETRAYTDEPTRAAPADTEEATDDTEVADDTLQEQIINEILGLFSKKNEDVEVDFSTKSTKFMRQDLEAMVDLLKSLKVDIGQYEKFATAESVSPRLDGSTLKRNLDAKLPVIQSAIADLIKRIDVEVQEQQNQLEKDAKETAEESPPLESPEEETTADGDESIEEVLSGLFEQDNSNRKVRTEKVKDVYNELRRMYLNSLKVSMDENNFEDSKKMAQEMKDYVLNEKEFMGFFPTNIITSSGQAMTLKGAHEAMMAVIKKFIGTIRDVVTITKTQKVSMGNLQQSVQDLVEISDAIASIFGVESKIDRDFMNKYRKEAAEEGGALTDEDPTITKGEQDPNTEDDVMSATAEFEDDAGKSEEEMVKLVDFIKGMEQTEVKSTLRELGLRFDSEEEQEQALSVLVYYIYDTMDELKEVVGPSAASKNDALREEIVSFLNKLKTATGMTDKMKDFVKTKQANLIKFLMSNAVKDLVLSYEEGGTGLMNQLKNLLTKNSPATKSVAKRMSSPLAPSPDADLEDGDGGSEELEDGDEEGSLFDEEELFFTVSDDGKDRKVPYTDETRETIASDPNGKMKFKSSVTGETITVPHSDILQQEGPAKTVILLKDTKGDELYYVHDNFDEVEEKVEDGTYDDEFIVKVFGQNWEFLRDVPEVRSAFSVASPRPDFDDLLELNNRMMKHLLDEIDMEDLRNAIRNEPKETKEFFLSKIDDRQKRSDMRDQIKFSGSVPKKKSREAQKKIVAAAIKLQNDGVISLSGEEYLEEALKPIINKMLKEHYNK